MTCILLVLAAKNIINSKKDIINSNRCVLSRHHLFAVLNLSEADRDFDSACWFAYYNMKRRITDAGLFLKIN